MVSPIFSGCLFYVDEDVAYTVVDRIEKRGGRVTQEVPDVGCIFCAVIPSPTAVRCEEGNVEDVVPTFCRVSRTPVVYDVWVQQCVACDSLLPLKGDAAVLAYDPFMFDGVSFTTTQLPRHIKQNVVAAMQFYGATYTPFLGPDTNMLVYLKILNSPAMRLPVIDACVSLADEGFVLRRKSKLEVAAEAGITTVTPLWVQACLDAGRLVDIPRV